MGWSKEELEELYWNRNMSAIEIARLKGCSERNVRRYMERFGIKRREKREALKLKYIKGPAEPKIPISLKMNPSLAYVLGVIMGDGFLHRNKSGNYKVELRVANRKFAESFMRALKDLGLHPHISLVPKSKENGNWHDQYHVSASSKALYEWIRNKTLNEIEEVLSDKDLIRSFLRGFYESEGSIEYRSKNSKRITIYNSDPDIVNLVRSLLERMGFRVSIYTYKRRNRKPEYNIRILGGTREAERFLSEIKPCIKGV